ncbi:MAG TPA: hemolysin family protein [Pseudolabrys sp.]|nr:hemolysin family protein [Pseudolabrys sp.]
MLAAEISIVTVLIVLNGLLAMSELAIVSSRPARLRRMVDTNITGARRALALASDPGKFLSTVQIGITLVGVLSGAFSGATIGLRLASGLTGFGLSAGVAEVIGIGMVVAATTYASLIIGELVPKQIALRNPEAVAVRVAPAMTMLAKATLPLVWVLNASGKAILGLLGQREQRDEKVTEEEIRTLIAEAEHAGVLEPGEKEMIASVMRLGDRSVRAVMTPRREVDMLNLSDSPKTIRAAISGSPHSRLPVYETDPDHVLGVVQAKDLLHGYMSVRRLDIRNAIRRAPLIPDSVDARDVVSILKASPVHIGLVVDEYGHFEGVVTSADILESIVGEFRTEESPTDVPIVRRDDGSLLISGDMAADEFAEFMGIPLPVDRSYHTVAGFILERFGKLPAVGESVDHHGWRFEVVDLDGRRVDKVLATKKATTRRALA